MGIVAVILCALGIVALIWGLMQKFKAGRMTKAPLVPTGEAASSGDALAGPKGALSVEGDVICEGPLLSPVTQTPCLYYELEVTGYWKEGDKNQSKKYVDEKCAVTFWVDDGSGAIQVDASKGGDFDPMEETFNETQKEGLLADLKGAVGKGKPIEFGAYSFENPSMSIADKFKCVETVFKMPTRLYVLGKYQDGLIGSPSFASLVLSTKGRDELLAATAKTSKYSLIGGGAAAGIGLILGIISLLISKPEGATGEAESKEPVVAQSDPSVAEPGQPEVKPKEEEKVQPKEPTEFKEASPPPQVEKFFGLRLAPYKKWKPVWDPEAQLAGWENKIFGNPILVSQLAEPVADIKSLKAAASDMPQLGSPIDKVMKQKKTPKGWWAIVKHGKDTDFVYLQKHKGAQFMCSSRLSKPPKGKPVKFIDAMKICNTLTPQKVAAK